MTTLTTRGTATSRSLAAMTLLTAAVTGSALAGVDGAAGATRGAAGRTQSSPADPVLAWNATSATIAFAAGSFQPEGLIRLASVQAAVFDAVVAIDGGFTPYVAHRRGSRGASVAAAVATAAHDTLVVRFPTQQAAADTSYAAALAAIPDGQAKSDGTAVGAQAAADVLAARSGDGLAAPVTYAFGSGPGAWILPTDNANPALQTPQTPWVAQMRPFLIERADQFRPGPPPALTSARYARDLNEVEAYGSATSAVRTPAQTDVARFWTANALTFNNAVARQITTALGLDAAQTARALALNMMVDADSLIACFDAKYHYSFWRPFTAIRGAGSDGNPATSADPTWVPLVPTPNHPEYPAAHACLSSADAAFYADLLGTRHINLSITSPATGTTHFFATPQDLDDEVINTRVWAGLHYRNSGQVGIRLGSAVANAALDDALAPTER
jgi:hypothetical protein